MKLDYEVGVFNGTGPILTRKANSKDAALRITATPFDWVKLGVNGSLKLFDKEERERENFSGENTALFKHRGWAAGANRFAAVAGEVMLSIIDRRWTDHLEDLERLDDAVGLRGYGQLDPLLEFKREAHYLYLNMLREVREQTLLILLSIGEPI